MINSCLLKVRSLDTVYFAQNTEPTVRNLVGSNAGLYGLWVELNPQTVPIGMWLTDKFVPAF